MPEAFDSEIFQRRLKNKTIPKPSSDFDNYGIQKKILVNSKSLAALNTQRESRNMRTLSPYKPKALEEAALLRVNDREGIIKDPKNYKLDMGLARAKRIDYEEKVHKAKTHRFISRMGLPVK